MFQMVGVWFHVMPTVLAVKSVSEEDVQSGVYHFPTMTNINGIHKVQHWHGEKLINLCVI